MIRRCLVLAAFALLSQWQSAYAQIEVAPVFQQGDKMVARVPIEKLIGADPVFEWSATDGVNVEPVGNTLYFWSRVGGKLTCKATYTLNYLAPDPTDANKPGIPSKVTLPPYTHTADFKVEGSGPAPDKPVTTLKELAGADADDIAIQLAALGRVLNPADAKYFPDALAGQMEQWKSNKAHAAIIAKLGKLTDHAKIVAEIASVVAELGGATTPDVPTVPTTPATAAVYIHEKDETPVPNAVRVALDRLNRERKIRATVFEDDVVDGDDDVPDQYKAPLDAARRDGLPSLVVMAGDTVLLSVKNPQTVEDVLEAVH